MTLQEILDDVDSRIANSVSISKKVKWINLVQRQLFRDYPLPEAIDRFNTVPNLAVYPLPNDCAEDRITNVTVGGDKYDYQSPNEEAHGQFWTIIVGQLMIYPTPTSVKEVMLYYRPRHNELSENNLDEVPNFPEDYHELLVYGCAERVAQVQRDVDMVNNFAASFAELAEKARRKFKKQQPRRVIARRWA